MCLELPSHVTARRAEAPEKRPGAQATVARRLTHLDQQRALTLDSWVEEFPVPLGDDFYGPIDHCDSGLIVNGVRRARRRPSAMGADRDGDARTWNVKQWSGPVRADPDPGELGLTRPRVPRRHSAWRSTPTARSWSPTSHRTSLASRMSPQYLFMGLTYRSS